MSPTLIGAEAPQTPPKKPDRIHVTFTPPLLEGDLTTELMGCWKKLGSQVEEGQL